MAQTGKRVKPSDKKKWLLLPIGLLAAAAIGFGGICAAAAGSDVIYPNTYMGDQDVGGMTRSEAAAALTPTLDAMEQSSGVRAMLDGKELEFFSFQDLGVQFDADESAASAFDAGRSGSLLSDGWNYLRARMGSKTHLIPQADSDWRSLAVDRIAQDCASEPTAPSYQLTDAGLLLTKGADGRQIDRAALRESLETAESDETGAVNVELPCTAVPAEQIDLGAVHEELASEMVNAGFDKATGTITPEHAGASFDVDEAQRMLTAAQPGETVTVPATVTLPEVTAEQLKSVLFRDVLGTYTTHVSGTSGRLSNVRLAAKRCNGAIMNSGETFNYNAIMAPYNGANGYYLAPGYVGGKTVDSYGGGVCQGSSTIYAAVLHANLEIVQRTAHGFASSYIGLGLDATVADGGPNFVFRNNTPYPIKLQMTYSNSNNLTVTILGTKTNTNYVKIISQTISTTPYKDEVVETTDLAPGVRKVEQTPYTGYLVKTFRNIYSADGKLISSTYEATSNYRARNRITLVGVGTPAEQTP
ncbi:MAG: VanW family protein, partial [Oscillospiraceae bacterium]|nr:VanW family protein [Oscillospiraceae bacterium]